VKSYRCYAATAYSSGLTNNRLGPRPGHTIDGFVIRKEYDDLKAELLAMKKESDAHKKDRRTKRLHQTPRHQK
jgi:hypothetical protein